MATDLFARIGGIKGESTDDRHKDEIHVTAWSWGISREASQVGGTGSGAGKASFAGFTFVHAIDRASPMLMKACATGEHIKEATITARKAGGGQQDYLTIKLTDVIVTSVTPSMASEAQTSTESITLEFRKVDVVYRAQKPDGSLAAETPFSYDIKTGKAL